MLSRQARTGYQGIALGLIRRLPRPDQAFPFRCVSLILFFGDRSAKLRQTHNALFSDGSTTRSLCSSCLSLLRIAALLRPRNCAMSITRTQ